MRHFSFLSRFKRENRKFNNDIMKNTPFLFWRKIMMKKFIGNIVRNIIK